VAREIAEFQAIRARQGLAPLWVATDQEGGGVSRLSPPLDQQPPLSAVHRGLHGEAGRRAVTAYAEQQGRGLASLGVNVNFAPVIDLDFGVRNPNDAYTRISDRAIAADPAVVSEVAGWYCDGLAAQGVRCTLKHFPGLGRVFEDTHHSEGVLDVSLGDLERMDWVPFRRLLGRADSLVMVGHVRLTALDASQPVSTSRQAVAGLIRGTWRYDGLVITDDLCMGAIYSGPGGIEQSGVRALNAGVDLLLVSWDGEQVYPLLAALLQRRSELDAVALKQSSARLHAAQAKLPAGPR
jgi:beta-N-acetylhexosaminidase